MAKLKSIGETIREARQAAGLTIAQVALAIGASWLSVQRYETSARIPPWETIEAISAACGVDADAVFGKFFKLHRVFSRK